MSNQFQPTNQNFNCGVCADDHNGIPHMIENDPVCADCVSKVIVKQFQAALEFEHNFPPKWGNVTLQARDFAYVLDPIDPTFVTRYERVAEGYTTPYETRIYCPHELEAATAPPKGSAILPFGKIALSREQIRSNAGEQPLTNCAHVVSGGASTPQTKLTCYHCGGVVCACGAALDDAFEDHACPNIAPDRGLEGAGLRRGRDFQNCPECGIAVHLYDACNHMTCACGAQFCYLCGVPATHNSGHWARGGTCPRYGGFDSDNFDEIPHVEGANEQAVARQLAERMVDELADRLAERHAEDITDEDREWRENFQNQIRDHHGQEMLDRMLAMIPVVEAGMHAHDDFVHVLQEGVALEDANVDADDATRHFIQLVRFLPINLRHEWTTMTNAFIFEDEETANNAVTHFAGRYVEWSEIMQDIDRHGIMLPRLQEYWQEIANDLPVTVMQAINEARERRQR